jgi:hypothetical protein
MFQPVGGDRIVVAVVEDTLADAAKQQWKGDPGSSCRIMAMNRRSNKSKTKKKATQAKGIRFISTIGLFKFLVVNCFAIIIVEFEREVVAYQWLQTSRC